MNTMHSLHILLIICLFWSVSPGGEVASGSVTGPSYVEVTDARGYKALVLMPANTSEAIDGKLPAILFLHGIGERGNDLANLKKNGFPRNLEGDQQFPFIFIMPQCPLSTEWYYTNEDNVTAMQMFLDDIISRFPIDTSRVYITGLSMGGIGSWYFAINMPTRFAALVPVAFRGDGWSPCPAKAIPVWAFHGVNDNVIPLSAAQDLVDQFKLCGGSIRFEPYPNGGHNASTWTVTYNNPDLYDWMLRKKKPTLTVPSGSPDRSHPHGILLEQNYPNPFNPSTNISFNLFVQTHVKMSVSNILGQTIAELLDESSPSGTHTVVFNAGNLPSGLYFCRLIAGERVASTKMTLLK